MTHFWETISACTYKSLQDKHWALKKNAATVSGTLFNNPARDSSNKFARLTIKQIQSSSDEGLQLVERLREKGEEVLGLPSFALSISSDPATSAASSTTSASFKHTHVGHQGQQSVPPALSDAFSSNCYSVVDASQGGVWPEFGGQMPAHASTLSADDVSDVFVGLRRRDGIWADEDKNTMGTHVDGMHYDIAATRNEMRNEVQYQRYLQQSGGYHVTLHSHQPSPNTNVHWQVKSVRHTRCQSSI